MKTLILNGSPRTHGDTAALLAMLTAKMADTECHEVRCYDAEIAPCTDCRYCRTRCGCAIQDEMQTVYQWIAESDNIVIASPIYFSQPTGRLLDVGSRLQTYFSGRFFRKEQVLTQPKKGAVLLAGGGSLYPERAYETAKILLYEMNAKDVYPLICSHDTDHVPAAADAAAQAKIEKLAAWFRYDIR